MNILIVEDESRIAKRIERMAREFFKESLKRIQIVESISQANSIITSNKPDLLLLDINLNGQSGFEILKENASESFDTIIVSAQKEFALTSFEFGVLDFVPKPFNRERLNHAFERIILNNRITPSQLKFLAVKKKNHVQLVKLDELLYIQGAGVYSELYLEDGRKELHNKSLEKLEQLLPEIFIRTHKSYLVKTSAIKEIITKPGSQYKLKLKNGIVLPIGRTKYKQIKEIWLQ
jgi:DNA-binding LytR/AlgR family response regulator